MARHYVLGSWANADEYDYSGEQLMGHRQGKSVCMDHMLPNGMANLKRYGDPVEQKPVTKKRKSVADKIDLAQRNFDRIEQMSIDLDNEYFAGELDEERYELLRYKLDKRLLAAWSRLEKENKEIWQKEDEKFLTEQQRKAKIQKQGKSQRLERKTANKSLICGDGWLTLALQDCKETNVFLRGIIAIQQMFKGEWK